MIKQTVFCTLQVEGLHRWENCSIPEVSYLADLHRHVFHIRAEVTVTHEDRDVEFIKLKHDIQTFLRAQFWDNATQLHFFGKMSCESIAMLLIAEFGLSAAEVSEDGENGGRYEIVDRP